MLDNLIDYGNDVYISGNQPQRGNKMEISKMTLDEIKLAHPHTYIDSFDAGYQDDNGTGDKIPTLDVIVWPDEASSVDDDGKNAIARYLIRA